MRSGCAMSNQDNNGQHPNNIDDEGITKNISGEASFWRRRNPSKGNNVDPAMFSPEMHASLPNNPATLASRIRAKINAYITKPPVIIATGAVLLIRRNTARRAAA